MDKEEASHFSMVIVGRCMNIERERCKNQGNFGFYVVGFICNYFSFFFFFIKET